MANYLADVLIQNNEGDPIAVIEAWNVPDLNREEAIEWRKGAVDYGLPTELPYLMLASQDIGFLWKNTDRNRPDAPPDLEFPMDKLVQRYKRKNPQDKNENPQERLPYRALPHVIARWLLQLHYYPDPEPVEPEPTLAQFGFTDVVKNNYMSLSGVI